MAELQWGKLATEKAMRAYQGSAAAANVTTVMRKSWQSARWSRSAGDAMTRAHELAEAMAQTWRRRWARERESQGEKLCCPRDRGRRGNLEDASGADKRVTEPSNL